MFEFSSTLSHSSLQPGRSGHPELPSSEIGHLQSSRNGPPQPSPSEHPQPLSVTSGRVQPPLAEGWNPLLPLLEQQQQQQQSAEADNSELLQWIQEQQERDRERGGAGGERRRAGGEEGGRAGVHPVGDQGPPFRPPMWQQRVREAIGQQQAKFMAKFCRVPGNSDSGQSSDELSARRARIQKRLSETSVPSPPPSNLTVGTAYSQFHGPIMTASSDSSSSEAQVAPGSEKKKEMTPQKVPRISRMRQLRIDQETRAAEVMVMSSSLLSLT